MSKKNINASVVNMRFLKPIDVDVIMEMVKKTKKFITVEENSLIGGLGDTVKNILFGSGAKIECIGLPDKFIEHGNIKILKKKYGFTPESVAEKALKMFNC